MSAAALNRLLVLDAETPWVWNMFAAMPEGWRADGCGPVSAGLSPRRWRDAKAAGHVAVPGWTRMFDLSTALLARQVVLRIRNARPRAIVHTIPWTAGILDRFRDVPHVYRPHDYFGMYSWDQRRIQELECKLVAECRFVAPNTEAQAGDFRKLRGAPLQVLPMAVSVDFVRRMRGPLPARPDDLPRGTPIVGCVGQITRGYDFDYCMALADAVAEAAFVYVGPIHDEGAELRRQVNALFARSNVTWLGPRPHERLPDYLSHFDVCFNPLAATAWNDRRSPLRLYDYLAAGKPVLSTNVAAAREHGPYVDVCATPAEAATRLRAMLSPTNRIDESNRRHYVDTNTWNIRAQQFTGLIDAYCH